MSITQRRVFQEGGVNFDTYYPRERQYVNTTRQRIIRDPVSVSYPRETIIEDTRQPRVSETIPPHSPSEYEKVGGRWILRERAPIVENRLHTVSYEADKITSTPYKFDSGEVRREYYQSSSPTYTTSAAVYRSPVVSPNYTTTTYETPGTYYTVESQPSTTYTPKYTETRPVTSVSYRAQSPSYIPTTVTSHVYNKAEYEPAPVYVSSSPIQTYSNYVSPSEYYIAPDQTTAANLDAADGILDGRYRGTDIYAADHLYDDPDFKEEYPPPPASPIKPGRPSKPWEWVKNNVDRIKKPGTNTVDPTTAAAGVCGGVIILLILFYLLGLFINWLSGGPTYYTCLRGVSPVECRESGCMYDSERSRCYLPAPQGVVELPEFSFPYKLLVTGYFGAGKTTCINNMLDAFRSSDKLPLDNRDTYQRAFMKQVEWFDSPGMDYSDPQAYFKTRKMVTGIKTQQSLLRDPSSWLPDRHNAINRIVVVLNVGAAVNRGWIWNSVREDVIHNWTVSLQKVEAMSSTPPLVILNTMGYYFGRSLGLVSKAIQTAYPVPHKSFVELNCKWIEPLELSKILYAILSEARENPGFRGYNRIDRIYDTSLPPRYRYSRSEI